MLCEWGVAHSFLESPNLRLLYKHIDINGFFSFSFWELNLNLVFTRNCVCVGHDPYFDISPWEVISNFFFISLLYKWFFFFKKRVHRRGLTLPLYRLHFFFKWTLPFLVKIALLCRFRSLCIVSLLIWHQFLDIQKSSWLTSLYETFHKCKKK